MVVPIQDCGSLREEHEEREQTFVIIYCHVLLVGVASSFIVWWYLSRIVEV